MVTLTKQQPAYTRSAYTEYDEVYNGFNKHKGQQFIRLVTNCHLRKTVCTCILSSIIIY